MECLSASPHSPLCFFPGEATDLSASPRTPPPSPPIPDFGLLVTPPLRSQAAGKPLLVYSRSRVRPTKIVAIGDAAADASPPQMLLLRRLQLLLLRRLQLLLLWPPRRPWLLLLWPPRRPRRCFLRRLRSCFLRQPRRRPLRRLLQRCPRNPLCRLMRRQHSSTGLLDALQACCLFLPPAGIEASLCHLGCAPAAAVGLLVLRRR